MLHRESLSDAKLVDRAYRVPRNLQQRFPSDMIELCQLQSRVRAVRSPAPHKSVVPLHRARVSQLLAPLQDRTPFGV